jgi:Binding-protein-dependent transport system inner membrane component
MTRSNADFRAGRSGQDSGEFAAEVPRASHVVLAHLNADAELVARPGRDAHKRCAVRSRCPGRTSRRGEMGMIACHEISMLARHRRARASVRRDAGHPRGSARLSATGRARRPWFRSPAAVASAGGSRCERLGGYRDSPPHVAELSVGAPRRARRGTLELDNHGARCHHGFHNPGRPRSLRARKLPHPAGSDAPHLGSFLSGLPISIVVIPVYQIFSQAGWLSLLPTALFLGVTSLLIELWLIKGYIDVLPVDMEEAARVEGASTFAIRRRIAVPLTLPGITAAGLFGFINAWGALSVPLILVANLAQ